MKCIIRTAPLFLSFAALLPLRAWSAPRVLPKGVRARSSVGGRPRITEWSRQWLPDFNEQYAHGFFAPGG